MDMKPVVSSNIESVGYDPVDRVMQVRFHNGRTYEYSDVPQHVHREMITDPSVGGYFNRNVKQAYDVREV